jgi:hypothetical protein
MLLGCGPALACALVTNAGFLVRHRRAVEAPPVNRANAARRRRYPQGGESLHPGLVDRPKR